MKGRHLLGGTGAATATLDWGESLTLRVKGALTRLVYPVRVTPQGAIPVVVGRSSDCLFRRLSTRSRAGSVGSMPTHMAAQGSGKWWKRPTTYEPRTWSSIRRRSSLRALWRQQP